MTIRRREFLGTAARGVGAVGAMPAVARAAGAAARGPLVPRPGEVRTLNGTANNLVHRRWGAVGSRYRRLTSPRYADAIGEMVSGPNPRYISNRIFNSLGVDLFSERNLSQLAWVWGQSLDHTFGFAKGGGESAAIACSPHDPMERYVDGLGAIPFTRDAMAAGSGHGAGRAREQVNTVNAYIDASLVYGSTRDRLDWMRAAATQTGHRERLGAELLLPGGYLPAATSRGDAARAPAMQIEGMLRGAPDTAFVAGDVRANENSELTAIHTLLAREHNRIVRQLPSRLAPEERFQIARRVVGAIQQHITYEEFLPALGVRLSPYRGYDPRVCSQLYGEFAAVGYRVHSMVNGEVHVVVGRGRYSEADVARLKSLGVTFGFLPGPRPQRLTLRISQSIAFFNPALLPAVGLGTMLLSLANEPGYRNDEQIDETLRSVLFERPGSTGVVDLGAIDIQRGRDHGMPAYNDLRRALGLTAHRTFTEITGEATERFGPGFGADAINNPAILAWRSLHDLRGRPVAIADKTRRPTRGVRASTVAARLRAIYGSVERVDAFVGMVSERHVPGTEFGELQLELWRRQFEALRDGDRFFYRGDPELERIRRAYGVDHRATFADLIARNTHVHRTDLSDTVFFAPPPELATPLGANAT